MPGSSGSGPLRSRRCTKARPKKRRLQRSGPRLERPRRRGFRNRWRTRHPAPESSGMTGHERLDGRRSGWCRRWSPPPCGGWLGGRSRWPRHRRRCRGREHRGSRGLSPKRTGRRLGGSGLAPRRRGLGLRCNRRRSCKSRIHRRRRRLRVSWRNNVLTALGAGSGHARKMCRNRQPRLAVVARELDHIGIHSGSLENEDKTTPDSVLARKSNNNFVLHEV